MMGNPLFIDTLNALGGNGIAMGYPEVYRALQTGVISGPDGRHPAIDYLLEPT